MRQGPIVSTYRAHPRILNARATRSFMTTGESGFCRRRHSLLPLLVTHSETYHYTLSPVVLPGRALEVHRT